MDFYTKLNNDIDTFYKSEDYIEMINNNNSNKMIKKVFKSDYNYPDLINDLIIEDRTLFVNIIERYKNIMDNNIDNNYTLELMLDNINKPLITNANTEPKIKYVKYSNIILEFLVSKEWFNIYYYETTITNEEPNILPNDFKWRINQLDAINKLNNTGLQTGIHCQATGTGKSYIIINYIDYIKKHFHKPKIILFTERVNILKDLFDFNKDNEVNMTKLEEWKNLGIGNLIKFNFINRVTSKSTNWVKIFNKSKKSTLLIINRAYLTLQNRYKKLKDVTCIIHDECHNTSSSLCYEFLKTFKTKNVPIIGFSATPLRSGKTDGQFNKDKLIDIYNHPDNDKQLNLITDYNIIYSIHNKLILPPRFYWYNIESYQSKKIFIENVSNEDFNYITKKELGAVMSILSEVVLLLPNKKIIAWCGTIELCKEWAKLFNKYKNMYEYIEPFELFVDYSNNSSGYDKFKTVESCGIMFCAMKHREGSDIKRLDCCLFLDKVKNRSSIPFIQSIGRVLRSDDTNEDKQYGYIIDGVIKDDEQYEKIFIDKILGYYFSLANLSTDNNNYDQYIKLLDVIKFDKELKIINLKLTDTVNIPIHCKKLDWQNIISKFEILLQNKVKLTPQEIFNKIIDKIKLLEPFQNPENDFWKEYDNLDHDDLQIPKDIINEFQEIWATKTWYDLLGFTKYSDINTFRSEFIRLNPASTSINKTLYKKIKNKFNLPNYPFEYYRLVNVTNYNELLGET